MKGLSPKQWAENDDTFRRRVHPAVPASCVARRLSADSLVRLPGKPQCRQLLGMRGRGDCGCSATEGLPEPIRSTHRLPVAGMPAVLSGPHGDGRGSATHARPALAQDGFVMITMATGLVRRRSGLAPATPRPQCRCTACLPPPTSCRKRREASICRIFFPRSSIRPGGRTLKPHSS